MILSKLKENKGILNEEINLDEPDIHTTAINIYELQSRDDFNTFSIDGENNVADHYGFSQNNWISYVEQGRVKPFIITTNNNECVAMLLLWSDNLYNFNIKDNITLSLPISFESNNDNGGNSYANFEYTLPLYNLLDKYKEFTGYNPDDYIVDGQYIINGKLRGIFKEFLKINDDGNFIYPENINLNNLNLHSLAPNSIVYSYFGGEGDANIHVNFYDNITEIANNAINTEGVQDLLFYCGVEDELPEVFNTLPEDIRNSITIADNDEVNQRRAERRAELERQEAERIEVEDREIVHNFDNAVNVLYSNIIPDEEDDPYTDYDPQYDSQLDVLQNTYLGMTDHQKELQTTYNKLQAAINRQQELKAEYDNKYNHELANDVLMSFNDFKNKVQDGMYKSITQVEKDVNALNDMYINSTDEVKNIINTEHFNFDEKVSELESIARSQMEQKRQQWLASHQNVDPNTTLYDNWLFVKFLPNGEASVIGYKKRGIDSNNGTLIIPNEVDGHKVTRIEKNAFLNLNRNNDLDIDSINIPETVKYIGPDAFGNSTVRPRFSRDIARNATNAKKVKLANGSLNTDGRAGTLYGKNASIWRDQNNDN